LLGPEAARGRALGHYFGPDAEKPDIAFLAADVNNVTRSVVVLRASAAVVSFAAAGEGRPEAPRVSAATAPKTEPIESMDLAGVCVGEWALLFNIEPRATRGAVWFETAGAAKHRALVTGLAPGQWDIWRNGWLVEQGAIVRPTAGALYFEGPAGTYFLRPAA
jgi:hypothetical protein